jgi:hypothetical protein
VRRERKIVFYAAESITGKTWVCVQGVRRLFFMANLFIKLKTIQE